MQAGTDLRPLRGRQRLTGALFLVSGVALVVHIIVGLPLWLTFPGGLVMAVVLLRWAGAFTGLDLRPLVSVGVTAGVVATAAYDLSRITVVTVFDLSVGPFEAFRFFGQGLLGPAAPVTAHWIAGGLFHVTNGLAFATAYTIWFGTRGIGTGIAWGLFLEAFMLGLYPGWLHIEAYAPFLAVSLIGHVVYGATLGAGARRLLPAGGSASEPTGGDQT